MVLGVNGAPQACYEAARADDARGLNVCSTALKEKLSTRDRAATLINRSALRILKGDLKGGIADCDESIKLHDGLGEAYLNRGVALRELGQPNEAIEALNKSIEAGLRRPQLAYFDRALAREDIGDAKGAYRDYKKALELAPDFTLAAEQLKRFRVSGA
jgi:tetratricopeptide (TPR) repeat protein